MGNVTWLVPCCLDEIPYFLATVFTSSIRQSRGLSRMPARILAAFATRSYGTARGTTDLMDLWLVGPCPPR
jgi:hypothetical protein